MSGSTLVLTHDHPIPNTSSGRKEVARAVLNALEGFTSGSKKATGFDLFPNTATPVAASGTVTLASCAANTVVEINGVDFIAVNGTATSGNNEFDMSGGGGDPDDATALAAAVNASTSTGIQYVLSASASSNVVTLTALQKGAQANSLTIKTGGVRANGTVTYVTPSGAQTIVINGVTVYSATAGATAALTAAAAAAAINASTDALISGHVKALARAGVVFIYAAYDGSRGNSITTTSTGTGSTCDQTRLANGTEASSAGAQATGTVTVTGADGNNYTVTINGVSTGNVAGTNGDDNATATSICNAIRALTSALVSDHVVATVATNVVTITARRGGVSGNTITLATTGTGSVASVTRLATGAVPTTVVLSGARLGSGAGGPSVTRVSHTF